MEMFLPAILGDLLGRSVSFLVQRYRQQSSVEDSLQKLQLALLRVAATVEEAEGRHITNQAMLKQLDVLREGMYRGYYMLDTFMYRAHRGEAPCRSSFALSRFNPAKRLCFPADNAQGVVLGVESAADLRRMVDSLGSMIADMKEFVIFLKGYPRICRQPYSMHLLLDKFMFGRQKEMEQIINFLLQAEASGNGLGVLPIVGIARVGKSTLVEHVCHHDRVRNHFSSIVFMSGDDLEDEKLDARGDYGLIKHRSYATHKSSLTLIILELADDAVPDAGRWRRLCSSAICRAHGSKIIITSRSEAVQRFGTVQALKLKFLRQEAYWYFFKVLAFGSTNPEDDPKLASIAKDISTELKGSFIGSNIAGSLLRANLDTQFWCRILKNMREYTQKHRYLFGKHPHDLLEKNRPVYLWRLAETHKIFLSYNCYQTCSAQLEIPKITLEEVLSGRLTPHGRFEALAVRSQIPPCYSYLMTCSVQTPPHMLAKKKRSRQQIT